MTREDRRLAQKAVLQSLLLYILWNDVRDIERVKAILKSLIERL